MTDHFDLNNSGWLSQAEIDEAKEIVLRDQQGLTSLLGIEYLTELTSLEVDDSPLFESVDISGNSELRSVTFFNTGMISLDVDGLSLILLSCDNSPLQALTLGAHPDLRILSCYGSELTEIDISGCPHLMEAYHSEKVIDTSTESDNYINGSYMLFVNRGASIITGIPEPSFFLPAALTKIDSEAFTGLSAKGIMIPKNVTEITGNPFSGSGLTTVYGYPGSAAETFADAYGYIFVPIDDAWTWP